MGVLQRKQQLVGGLCLAGAAAIWGGTYVVSKYVLDFFPPMTLVVIRFAIAALALWLVLKWQGGAMSVKREDWGRLARYGLVGYTISISAQFIGTKLSSAHMGAVLTSASPAFIALFALWILRERLTLRKSVSLIVATLGVLIVVGWNHGGGDESSTALAGNLFLVAAAVTWALYSVMGKVLTERYPALLVTFWASVCGTVFTMPIAGWELTQEPLVLPTDLLIWGGVLYLGLISTAVAFFLWVKGFEMMDAGTAGLFFFVQPIVGTVLGWLLLGEELTTSFLIGSALIVASVFFSMQETTGQESAD